MEVFYMKRYLLIACAMVATTAHGMQQPANQVASSGSLALLAPLFHLKWINKKIVARAIDTRASAHNLMFVSKAFKKFVTTSKKFRKFYLAHFAQQCNPEHPVSFRNFADLMHHGYKNDKSDLGIHKFLNIMSSIKCLNDDNAHNIMQTLFEREKLDLNHNRLTALPDNIGNLAHLIALNLEGNHLTSLPNSIGNLTGLAGVNLNNNRLTSLPNNIGNLTQLKYLYLSDNQLTVLPNSIGNLANLKVLELQNNRLTSLPDSICNLTNLGMLYLNNNQLTTLPDSIGNLADLEILGLSNNQLTALPDSIGNLANLKLLYLHNNHLDEESRALIQELKKRCVKVIE
jgi:hypothetical protein